MSLEEIEPIAAFISETRFKSHEDPELWFRFKIPFLKFLIFQLDLFPKGGIVKSWELLKIIKDQLDSKIYFKLKVRLWILSPGNPS